MPKQFEQLPAALAKLGYSLNDVEAVLLTHAYSDHIGSAPQIRSRSGACLEIPKRKVVFTGDALVTLSMTTGRRTPRIMPRSFNKSSRQALESLDELSSSQANVILPGHGEPWHGSVAAAVNSAQQTGPN